jgi:prephenate dehydrogenase
MTIKTLTIVGVGLIGGSIGLAARRHRVAHQIIGIGRRQDTLDQARSLGAIDEATLNLAAGIERADVAVFCTPVNVIAQQVLATAPRCAAGTLLTDAGSTKATIVSSIEGRLPFGVAFVGSHPLAGSEKRGPEHATADLFQDRLTVVTRTAQTDLEALERTIAFWRALGSKIHVMDPQDHDRALAFTSHLPHLVAAALAGSLPPELHELTATGFRDMTRVAAGDPALWTAILEHNRDAVLAGLAHLGDRLNSFGQALAKGDWTAVTDLLVQAKRVRDALGN